jgi:hypothetical protein
VTCRRAGWCSRGLGNLADYRTEYERAEEPQTKSLEVSREADDRRGIASAMGNLSVISILKGDLGVTRGLALKGVEVRE